MRITLVFMILQAIFWFGFGIAALTGLHPALPGSTLLKWAMGGLAIAVSIIFILIFILLHKRLKIGYYAALAVLVVVGLLTIFDEVGWVDLAYLVTVLVPLLLLLVNRKWYLKKENT